MLDTGDEKYEELRLIVEKQDGRAYTLEEAKEIGDGLIDFYELLCLNNYSLLLFAPATILSPELSSTILLQDLPRARHIGFESSCLECFVESPEDSVKCIGRC